MDKPSAQQILTRFVEHEYRLQELGRVELTDEAGAIQVTAFTPGGAMLREIEVQEPARWTLRLAAFSAGLISEMAPERASA